MSTTRDISRRTFLAGAAAAVGTSALAACGSGTKSPSGGTVTTSGAATTSGTASAIASATNATSDSKAKYRLTAAIVNATSDYNYVMFKKFADTVNARTNGQVTIDIHPNGELGAEADYFRNLQNGSLVMASFNTAVANATVPETLLFQLPYVFKDLTTSNKAMNGPASQGANAKLSALDIQVLSWKNFGVRHIGAKKNYETPDMGGAKVRVIQSPLYVSLFKEFNAVPTPLAATDVYSALQQGLVTAYDQPLNGILSSKWYEVANKVTLTYHSYSAGVLAMNKQRFSSLPQNLQDILMQAAAENTAENDAGWVSNEDQFATQLKGKGVVIIAPSLDPWRAAGAKIYPQFASQVGGMSVIENLISSQ